MKTMPRVLPLFAALLVATSAAPPVASAADSASNPVTVEIRDMKYAPETLVIPTGTKVTWINRDDAPHTVTDRGRKFASAALDTGDSYSYTFESPGEFTYFCTIHQFMVGKVVVRRAGSSP